MSLSDFFNGHPGRQEPFNFNRDKKRICRGCGNEFQVTTGTKVRCEDCGRKHTLERMRNYGKKYRTVGPARRRK